jgi:hypothetical protein
VTTVLGPVSTALEADLRTWARRHGIVVWLDVDGHYSSFVDRLSELGVPYQVRAFRGSHLELMLALEPLAGGVDKIPLVIHLPGFTEETVRTTPMFELYEAGVRYRKSLDTAVTEAASGVARPEQIAAFRERGHVTLDGADAWLLALVDAREGGLAAHLRVMRPSGVIDDLLEPKGGFMAEHLATENDANALWQQLEAWTGLPVAWREGAPGLGRAGIQSDEGRVRAEGAAFAVASWALCVEYVDDLRREPMDPRLSTITALPRPVIDACRELAAHLRNRHQGFYERTADEIEASLVEEVETRLAEDLGRSDTFRFEETRILKAALAALGEQRWSVALEWAGLRIAGESFWLRDDPARQSAWQLVQDGARLGAAIQAASGSLGAKTGLEQATQRYVERGAAVDQAHRHFAQRRTALLYPSLPEFETIRDCLDGLRVLWREWADAWACDFNALCKSHGFLPEPSLQQRTLFEDVVRPLAQEPGTTALFVIDAFRFEMGEELHRALAETPATTIQLRARLAELPTVTEVGMNVLAPVADHGRLRPTMSNGRIQGFTTGEYRVSDPASRKRAMHDRVGGDTCPWLSLEEVVSRDASSLKQAVARARLVVVHSQEIDQAGDNGAGPAVFDHVMQKLRAAWRLLREAGVRRFIFTADHGFLLLDETTPMAQAHGRKIDPKRRHVFSTAAADHAGEVRVSLADLGYEGTDEQLMFPESTAVFDTGRHSMSFVHGGNSLQERIIPVLTLSHRAAAGGSTLCYAIAAEARDEVGGMQCLEGKVDVVTQDGLDFGSAHEVELSLRVPDAPGVQIELCQTRRGARLSAGTIVATVGETFELFFRLSGSAEERVRVELQRAVADVEVVPWILEQRFSVAPIRKTPGIAPVPAEGVERRDWLDELPAGGIRQFFEHLAAHGAVTEIEAATMLGGQRALRRFALDFDKLAGRAPFRIRIDVVAGVKRYVREGTAS